MSSLSASNSFATSS
ncbi:hypothetical protein D049_2197A, partial [Vibrio parahaemolyticus VPTS-2010]